MPSKPVTAAKEEDRLVSIPSLARLSSLAELQRDTPAATRAINDGFNYTVKSITTNPLLIAVPAIALTIYNYFAHQIFPYKTFQVNLAATKIHEVIEFHDNSGMIQIPTDEVQFKIVKLLLLFVAILTWIGFYHDSWTEKSAVNDLRGKPNMTVDYFSVCSYYFPGKLGLVFGSIKHQVATIALWFGACYSLYAVFDYGKENWKVMKNDHIRMATAYFGLLTITYVVFHVLTHVVLPIVLASWIVTNDDLNGLDAVKRAIKLADRTRSHETIFIVVFLMTFLGIVASIINTSIIDPLIEKLEIGEQFKLILEALLDGLTAAFYYSCLSYSMASIYLHINGVSARTLATVRASNPPVAAVAVSTSSNRKSPSKSPARSRASSSSTKKRAPSKSKSPKK